MSDVNWKDLLQRLKQNISESRDDNYSNYFDKSYARLGFNSQLLSPDRPCSFFATVDNGQPIRVYPSEYVDCEALIKSYPNTLILIGKRAFLNMERSQLGVFYVLEIRKL